MNSFREKKLLVGSEDYGKDLTGVQNLRKKHKRLDAELASHEPAIQVNCLNGYYTPGFCVCLCYTFLIFLYSHKPIHLFVCLSVPLAFVSHLFLLNLNLQCIG